MINIRFGLRKLFSNTRFLVAFSIVVAFIFWIVVALEYAPVVENEIKDIPVKIDMSNSVPDKLGLQIFGQSEFTVNVTVKGNRYIVGGDLLTADDFDVTAQTAYVDSAGMHSLLIKVTAKDANADYEIVSKSADYIDVYFDKYAEKEVELKPRIISELDSIADDDCIFDEADVFYSNKTVKLSGAQQTINSVTSAYADIYIDKPLSKSDTVDAEVVLTNNGRALDTSYVKINGESSLTVPVTLPVYKLTEVSTEVSFKNAPSGYIGSPMSYTVSPSKIKVAVLQTGSATLNTLNIGSIDFAEITPSNSSFTFAADDIKDVKFFNGIKNFSVDLDTGELSAKELELNRTAISVTKPKTGLEVKSIDYSSIGKINVVGKADELKTINSDDLKASIDLSSTELKQGSNTVEVDVTLSGSDYCWVVGTYRVNVTA